MPQLIAGIDVSLNEKGGQSHWQLQLYGVTHAANEKALRDAFGEDRVEVRSDPPLHRPLPALSPMP